MKQTQLFTKTQKNIPADEVSKNAQLLIRAGFIHKEMAGVYDLLPLGMRVVENIKKIVREEMNKVGGVEFLMSSLQTKNNWTQTNRWDDEVVDVWFKSKLKAGGEVGFGWSHEEPITEMMKTFIHSYKDLPVYVYQFQNKMRNEVRAKAGIMRGREFIMKDMYSFSTDEKQHEEFYQNTIKAYQRCFEKLGLGEDTFITFADGGAFTEFSHEFQTICDAGEDEIYINREKHIAINQEVYNDETLKSLDVTKDELEKVKTAEVGNIFNFGTEKCEQMKLYFTDKNEEKIPVFLGSYGIGITRVMGVIAEKFSDQNGLIWPENIAPFKVHLINIGQDELSEQFYNKLQENGIEVLHDNRDKGPGEKFKDADLIGIPYRIVISDKTVQNGGYEIKKRDQKDFQILTEEEILEKLK
ncbi:prolyl-tRNA synthetase [Candidatus Campbellbacteria bacterium]|nr:MAG: prolyl-tRNA synthetase [Candidatus Campbellbacteria bacterium]